MLALALALALGAADPCVATDELGRSFRSCFAPGEGFELSGATAWADARDARAVFAGGLALRWRSDTFAVSGRPEWLRDMAFVETRARFHGTLDDPRAAEGTLWSGLFIRRLAESFLLVPAARKPIRLPFPFDVGMAIDAGRVAWRSEADAGAERLDVEAVRGALLLDVARHLGGPVRRASFGPEVSWAARFEEGSKPVQYLAPFSAARVELLLETADGLTSLRLSAHGGWALRFPTTNGNFFEGRLAAERVLFAINDLPFSLYAEGSARGGIRGEEREAIVGFRMGAGR